MKVLKDLRTRPSASLCADMVALDGQIKKFSRSRHSLPYHLVDVAQWREKKAAIVRELVSRHGQL